MATTSQRYAGRKSRGLCGSCGVRKPSTGFGRCLPCRRRENAAKSALCERRLELGLCVQCGGPTLVRAHGQHYTRCEYHRELHAKRQRARMVRLRIQAAS